MKQINRSFFFYLIALFIINAKIPNLEKDRNDNSHTNTHTHAYKQYAANFKLSNRLCVVEMSLNRTDISKHNHSGEEFFLFISSLR